MLNKIFFFFTCSHASPTHFVVQTRLYPDVFHRRTALDLLFEEFTYIILEWLVNNHIKWLNFARCTSWDINQSCFAFMKSVLYIGCLLDSLHVCIKYFAGGSRSWWVVENIIPILFEPLFHDRFITPCLMYLPRKVRRGGSAHPSAKMVNWTVHCRFSRSDWPLAIQTSSALVFSYFLISSITKANGVWSVLP